MIRNNSIGNNINININGGSDNTGTQTDRNCEENDSPMMLATRRPSSLKTSTDRPSPWTIILLGLLGLYSFASNRYLFIQEENSILIYGERDATLRRCVDSADGLWTPQDNYLKRPAIPKNASADFQLLCTSEDRRISWGSYKLRCNDLKRWADVCAPDVDITVGVSIEQLHELWSKKKKANKMKGNNTSDGRSVVPKTVKNDTFFNATIFIKSMSKKTFPQFGKKFVDIVDEYNWKAENVPLEMHLILQTQLQGEEMYPNHTSTVIEHWYNSYPDDMVNGGYPEFVPSINQKSRRHLRIATVWNTRRSRDPTEGGCPAHNIPGVKYDCVDKDFDITLWYEDMLRGDANRCQMVRALAYPQLGMGMLYYNVFRKYDGLVVLAKNHTEKLNYGNVQRAISQMRSGVPVLLEIRGKVLEDFMDKYNYSCAFRRYYDNDSTTPQEHEIPLMSFDKAVEKLKDPAVREECQRQGLEIVKDYSPSKIGQKFLRTVGYQGEFTC